MRTEVLVGDRGSRLVVRVAETRRERMRGLIGSAPLRPGAGLLLERTRSVHTVGMRWTVTAALLDRELRVLAVLRVPPNRVVAPRRGVRHVLELGPGAAGRVLIGEAFQREAERGTRAPQPPASTLDAWEGGRGGCRGRGRPG